MIFSEKPLSIVMEILRKRGYTEDFNLLEDHVKHQDLKINPEDLVIDKVYRFTGLSDLDDESTLYAMSYPTKELKGVFVDGYGIYANPSANKILSLIPIYEDDSEDWTSDES